MQSCLMHVPTSFLIISYNKISEVYVILFAGKNVEFDWYQEILLELAVVGCR